MMILARAVITGCFCVVFAMFISWVGPQLSSVQLLGMSFVSGFLGSLVARAVIKDAGR